MSTKGIVNSVRSFRKFHKWMGIVLAIFLLLSALTGVLLGWKKNVDLLQPPTQSGVDKALTSYKPVEELARASLLAVDSLG
ncbi:MAG: PepSY domain-containing protein, partial [Roseivirga sp.]|nr:PepSY domain-containing protein [Roseivirga sp.]